MNILGAIAGKDRVREIENMCASWHSSHARGDSNTPQPIRLKREALAREVSAGFAAVDAKAAPPDAGSLPAVEVNTAELHRGITVVRITMCCGRCLLFTHMGMQSEQRARVKRDSGYTQEDATHAHTP